MKNYFDFGDRVNNEDTYDRQDSLPHYNKDDSMAYDRILTNKILNQAEALSEADKYNLASIIHAYMKIAKDTGRNHSDFISFLTEKFGEEWYRDVMKEWQQV